MRKLALATFTAASLALAASAHASPVDLTGMAIWSGNTPGNTSSSPAQQALPSTTALLPQVAAFGAASGPIAFSVGPVLTNSTIGDFLNSAPVTYANCGASCRALNLSAGAGSSPVQPSFSRSSLFEMAFSVATAGTATFTHDDGFSLFAAGDLVDNLAAASDAIPTIINTSEPISLAAGNYLAFYEADNGNPEVFSVNFIGSHDIIGSPEPATWLLLLGLGLSSIYALRRSRGLR
jgi:hypothetical protein